MSKVRFRADGNNKIGQGHLVRCFSLAQMIADDFDVSFYFKSVTTDFLNQVKQYGFHTKTIDTESDFINDVLHGDIVVLDGYDFDIDYQKILKSIGATVVCIDDIHNRPFACDVIVNHAPGLSKDIYHVEHDTKFLLGPQFALLRPAFIQQALLERPMEPLKRVLVCFGGSDPKNLTVPITQILLDYNVFKEIIVVTGVSYSHLKHLHEIVSSNPRVIHHHNINDEKLVECLNYVQLAVVPASGILFEVIACKTPAICGYYVDNQLEIYKGFKGLRVFFDVGRFDIEKIRQGIEWACLGNPYEFIWNQTNCIDGMSPGRYRQLFKSLKR